MIDGDEYNSVYNTYDWRHVPGVTAPFVLATHYGFDNDSNDCWGVTNGTYGATAYTFNKHDGTNKRTWGKIGYFFFDNEYVALGAGIGANHAASIHTTLNQAKAADVSVNGEAVAVGHFAQPSLAGRVDFHGFAAPPAHQVVVMSVVAA